MADITIPNGGTYTLTAPLASGTNIDFINSQTTNSGVLIVDTGAFNITTVTTSGTASISSVSFGGEVKNFQPAINSEPQMDGIDIANIDSLYASLDVSSNAAVENRSFDNVMAFSAESSDVFVIMPDGSIKPGVENPTHLDANAVLIIDQIVTGLFGTGASATTLELVPYINNGTISAQFNNLDVAVNACFTPGTRILTVGGEVEVERLAVGDRVITRSGEDEAIVWIGHRDLDISRHARPEQVRPVIFEPDALAEGVPVRRLVLSPDHALYLDGVLIPAKELLNGTTIRADTTTKSVRYFHVELAAHNVLFAEGAAAESFLDTGHRGVFANAAEPLLLHPDLMQQRREAEGCAPLCISGPRLDAIRERLARRRAAARRFG